MALTIGGHERFEKKLSASVSAAQKDPQKHERRVRRWLWVGSQICALASFLRLVVKVKPSIPVRSAEQTNAAQKAGATTLVDEAAQASSTSHAASKSYSTFDSGRELKRGDAPALFALLDDLCVRAAIKTPPAVFLVDSLNAAVELSTDHSSKVALDRQRTSNGSQDLAQGAAPGNRLAIGRDLLEELTVEELRAVLAHELGHIVGRQTKLMHNCMELRRHLSRIRHGERAVESSGQNASEKPRLTAALAHAGARWFERRLWVHVFPVYRNAEREADCFAAHITGREVIGRALIRIAITRTKRSCYLPFLIDELNTKGFGTDKDPLDERILAMCLSKKTNIRYPHPCLGERLSAINVPPEVPPSVEVSAMSLIKQKESRPVRPWLRRAIAFFRMKCYRV